MITAAPTWDIPSKPKLPTLDAGKRNTHACTHTLALENNKLDKSCSARRRDCFGFRMLQHA